MGKNIKSVNSERLCIICVQIIANNHFQKVTIIHEMSAKMDKILTVIHT